MYRAAIALRPDSPASHTKFGSFRFAQGRFDDAIAHFRKATELVPDFWYAHVNLGGALQARGRYDEALAAYERSLALESTAPGWSNVGALQYALGRYGDSVKSFRRACDLAPSDPVMWANLGDACRAATDAQCESEAWPRAIDTARAALAINGSDAMTRALLASPLAKHGSPDEAQREIRRALETDPTSANVLYQAAVVAALRGADDSAVSWLERAIAAGYPSADAERDPVLASLRRLPSFRTAIKSHA